MKVPALLSPILNVILGSETRGRFHTAINLVAIPIHAVGLTLLWHLEHKGQVTSAWAWLITLATLLSYALFYGLVRGGASKHLADPAMAFPHAIVCQAIFVLVYLALGPNQALAFVLMAQIIVGAMLRLKPHQVLQLGSATAGMLVLAFTWSLWQGTAHTSTARALPHLIVGCSSLLLLSLVGKWVSDIRVTIGDQAKQLRGALATVQTLATQDQLTGLLNRRMMLEKLQEERQISERHGMRWCVALIDLDHFKQVNDRYGHAAGDAVLRGFADLARTHLRAVDVIGRWGGEEFLVLFPRTTTEESLASIQRLRMAFEEWRLAEHPDLRMSFSAGLTEATPEENLDHVIERADKTMYQAKASGRGRVMWSPSVPLCYEKMVPAEMCD